MTDDRLPEPLAADVLSPGPFAASLDFETTATLDPLDGLLGQDRALDAIRMAAGIGYHDFNLFVLGHPGSGRRSAVREMLHKAAAARPKPRDWVYVNNFDNPDKPRAMALPPGMAQRFRAAMEALIDDLASDIPALFESDEYQNRRRAIEQAFSEQHEAEMNDLVDQARERHVAILRTPMGLAVAATRDGEPIKPDQYAALSEDEQARIDEAVGGIQERLEAILKKVPRQQKEHRRQVEELNAAMAAEVVDSSIRAALQDFSGMPEAAQHVAVVRNDMIENAELFLMREDGAQAGAFPVASGKHFAKPQFQRYVVNVIVSHDPDGAGGAPVIEEDLPTLGNLIGRIEYRSVQGVLVTDFTHIKPGALHKANGGYLVLDARQVLTEPFAWEALKRILRTREIAIFSAADRYSLLSTESLEPDTIPMDLRLVLIGERFIYYLLSALDEEFGRLFKIQADFDEDLPLTAAAAADYARLIATIQRRESLCPVERGGVARLMAESTRMADDAERLSLNLGQLSDLLREADFWARKQGAERIGAAHVEQATDEWERRANRVPERMRDAVIRGTILIDTDGARAGQINALSVTEIAGHRFGRPSRVTARVRMGSGKVVDIERETELGGPLHSKGMMILQGYLATQYAMALPMSLWASIVFEQSYGGIDGDSASAAELAALVSALAELPIDQSLAITGSVNQFGDIQAIGGVNEKIEGFFDICAERGLTGRQGVLIPASNVKHLSLRGRVVKAVREGRFRILPISEVGQALALLTGRPAGRRGPDGLFPEASVNRLAEDRLTAFAEARRSFGAAARPGGEGL